MSFQRARSEDQIQDRIKEIISATSSIYDSVGYEGLNFSIISEYTKFTRQNIYKYFRTKDEILLLILKEDFKAFISAFFKSFKINKLYSLYEITDIWTCRLIEHERLLNLYAILYTTIEKNVSLESLVEAKKEILTSYQQLVSFISQLFPKASEDNISNFISSVLTLACGLYSSTKLSKLQIEATKLADENYTFPDFKKVYMSCFYQQLYCLKHSIEIKLE
jgi:AcrR family transcriptional regulator